MSTKVKRKSEKTKTKKIKRAPLKESYNEEEIIELKHKYEDILFHLSNFLSDHNVYEAVPENAKILVFSSELSFYEMIKVFIIEDIYCGLIYDPKLNNYLGLITTRDLMILYKYIYDNLHSKEINDFDIYLKDIFSRKVEKMENNNENNINNNINIFEHLQNINYFDYLIYAKRIEFENISILSVSLDDNLLDTLKKINIKNIHRLLVEEDNKNKNLIKESQKMEIKEEIKKQENEEIKSKRRISQTEKITTTTTTNYDDEENKNNLMFGKKEIKQNDEINNYINETKAIEEKISEEANYNHNQVAKEEKINDEHKHVKKKIIKKKKKVENENKQEIIVKTEPNHNHNNNHDNDNDEQNKSKDDIKPKKKKIIKKKKNKNDELEHTESHKEEKE